MRAVESIRDERVVAVLRSVPDAAHMVEAQRRGGIRGGADNHLHCGQAKAALA
jgi:hypothetical protein